MKNILVTYEQASGLAINFSKSEIIFSRNVSHDKKVASVNCLNVREGMGQGKYLGLPSMIG